MQDSQNLTSFLKQHSEDTELNSVIEDILSTCTEIANQLQFGSLAGVLGSAEQENVQGECQKKLDVISNDMLKECLASNAKVKGLASEEEEYPVQCNSDGRFLVLFDPLDGSSNIDVNVTVGTIFSVLEASIDENGDSISSYLKAGHKQIAAGYVLYGPSTILMLSTGKGVHSFTLNPQSKSYILQQSNIMIPRSTQEFAINMSNQRFWLPSMQQYVADLLLGEEGPLEKRYNMRWIASMVAEVHRILTRGGIFMYPFDNREPSKPGKLRLMYEGNPMSFLIEQAGGKSTTAYEDIMSIEPTDIHQRVSVVLGSADEVDVVTRYHAQ